MTAPAPPTYAALVARRRAAVERCERADLAAFIAASPGYTRPEHLRPYLALLARARTESVRAVVSAPPRHGKSEATLHYIVQCLLLDPTDRLGYATYAAEFSEQQGKRALMLAEQRGLVLAEKRANFWRTAAGGEVMWTSIGGPLTGKGFRKLIVDDPVKGRAEADSAAYREAAWAWFNAVAYTRLEPGGSLVVMATRWHLDDLSGRLAAQGWPVVNLPALGPADEALWPAQWPAAVLQKTRAQIGPYEWSSLYQGEPRSKGGRVFGDVVFYEPASLPPRYRVVVGVDLAYTAKRHADYSAAVVLARSGDDYFILDVVREQEEAPHFFARLLNLQTRYPGARFVWHTSTTEAGLADMMVRDGLNIEALLASGMGDKFARAQPVAAAWNAEPVGRVAVLRGAAWADAFVSELAAFTGVNDWHDDQVDALSTAFVELAADGPIHAPPLTRGGRWGGMGGRGF